MKYSKIARLYRRLKQDTRDLMYRMGAPLRVASLLSRFILETLVFIMASVLLLVATVFEAFRSMHNHGVYYQRVRRLHGKMVDLGAKTNRVLKLD